MSGVTFGNEARATPAHAAAASEFPPGPVPARAAAKRSRASQHPPGVPSVGALSQPAAELRPSHLPVGSVRPAVPRSAALGTSEHVPAGSASVAVQRMCTECKEEEKKPIQTKPAAVMASLRPTTQRDSEGETSPVLDVVGKGGGQPLAPKVRAKMEAGLGADFSDVRIHTGAKAAQSAAAVSAEAYTVGNDVVFGHGSFAPGSLEGRHTLAHELAHVQQQRRGPVPGTDTGGGVAVSDPSDSFEREADATASRVVPGPQPVAGVPRGGIGAPMGPESSRAKLRRPWAAQRPGCDCGPTGACLGQSEGEVLYVQRFGSAEHVRLGNEAESGQSVLVTQFGVISYGEMIALGDYFSSAGEIESLAASPDGQAQISYALWKVNPAGRPRPPSNPTAEQEVEDRYNRLAAHNETHFSTGSSAGNSNREQYIARHSEALRTAWFQGLDPLVVRRSNWQAQEALAAHFLTDAFSAGHIRTPRGAIQQHWESLFPNFRQDLVTTIACYMASYINHRDTVGWLVTVDFLTGQIAETIRAQGGSRLSSFSIGDLISKVLHDADNAGLDVVSRQGPGGTGPIHWRAVGDEFLFPSTPDAAATQTAQFTEAAIRMGFDEGQQAEQAGRVGSPLTPLLDESRFRALALLPAEDPASSRNPSYVWQVSSLAALPPNIQGLIGAAFNPGHEIRNGLDAMDQQIQEITTAMGFDLHTGEAWRCFKEILLRDVLRVLALIGSGQTCPPGKQSPCPTS